MSRRNLLKLCWLLALAVPNAAIVGCGSSSPSSGNGVASKSADAIINESRLAANGATSVHVTGSVKNGGAPVTLDLSLQAGKGGTGDISQNGSTFRLIIAGNTAYISGSAAFYRHLGGSAAVQLLAGKWLKVPTSTGEFASFATLTDMRKLISTTLATHGTLVKGATTAVSGQKAIAVTDTTRGGTLLVATTGKPYPLQISKGGSESGSISFSRWNQPVTVTPPTGAVDLSELKSLAGH